MIKKKEFVVKRSSWLHGEGMNASYLYRSTDGKMCCLGHLGLTLGFSKQRMKDQADPEMFTAYYNDAITRNPDKFRYPDEFYETQLSGWLSDWAAELIEINDNMEITQQEREKLLTEKFAERGWVITFVD